MERNGNMVVADAEKSLAAPKAGDLPNLIFGKVQLTEALCAADDCCDVL